MKIIVCDDDESLLHCFTDLLNLDGHEVLPAKKPSEAIELLRTHSCAGGVDLVIIDQVLPEMPGSELVGKIHEMGLSPRILLCTAMGKGKMGLNGYEIPECYEKLIIRKPFDIEEFLKRVYGG